MESLTKSRKFQTSALQTSQALDSIENHTKFLSVSRITPPLRL
jgi:hypothetical protein